MTIEELHWNLELEYDKLSNSHHGRLTDPEKDRILNIAIHDYVEMFLHGTNPKKYNVGFEVNQQRIDMLDTLVVSYPEQPLLTITQVVTDIYSVDFSNTILTYKSYQSASMTVDNCPDDIGITVEQHGDLNTVLNDFHRSPSKKWKRGVGTIRNNILYIYTKGEYIPKGLKLTFIKKPAEVILGTYAALPTPDEPNPTILLTKTECDLPSEYHDLVILLAVQNLQRIYEQPSIVLTNNKINEIT